jgi:hypothetical protein
LYRQVYQKMYQKLKPLYEQIMDITGYPGKVNKDRSDPSE